MRRFVWKCIGCVWFVVAYMWHIWIFVLLAVLNNC